MSGQSGLSSFLPLILLVVAAYFLLIRPQQQRTKQQAEMRKSLEPGVEIMTMSGIFGTIVEVGSERLRIATVDGSEFEIVPAAVRDVLGVPADELEDDEESEGDSEPPVALDEPADEPSASTESDNA